MLIDAGLGFINHLLADERWARDRLKPFAGRIARLQSGTFNVGFGITAEGTFSVAGKKSPQPDVTITLPADAPIRALIDRAGLLAAVQINGAADLAECLGFVLRHLRWDVENDLSPLVGDIAAHRIVQGSRQLAAWHLNQARNLALNLAEYLTEENPLIAQTRAISGFRTDVGKAQEHLLDLEKRVAILESR